MAFQVSPGVNISEVDLTAGVQTVSLSAGAFVGPFQWGPALDVINVGSEQDLVQTFGKPDANTATYWFSAASFLFNSVSWSIANRTSSGRLMAFAGSAAAARIACIACPCFPRHAESSLPMCCKCTET